MRFLLKHAMLTDNTHNIHHITQDWWQDIQSLQICLTFCPCWPFPIVREWTISPCCAMKNFSSVRLFAHMDFLFISIDYLITSAWLVITSNVCGGWSMSLLQTRFHYSAVEYFKWTIITSPCLHGCTYKFMTQSWSKLTKPPSIKEGPDSKAHFVHYSDVIMSTMSS